MSDDTLIQATVTVYIEPVPNMDPASDEWHKWCKEHDMHPLGSERRAWIDSLNTYLRSATGVVYWQGDMIGLWTDDLPTSTN